VGERNIFIVEDATQATGNRVGPADQAAGTLGDIGVLSFGRGKPLSVLSGGAILTADEELRQAVRKPWNELPAPAVLSSGIPHLVILSLYSLFFHPRLFWIPQKMPRFRVGETYFTLDFPVEKANPGVGRMLKLIWPRLDSIRQVRNLVAQEYRRGLEGCSRVVLPSDPGAGSSLLRFALIFDTGERRDRALRLLSEKGLGVTGMYPAPLHRIEGLDRYFTGVRCPNAESLAERILTLPLHDKVLPGDVSRITEGILQICGQKDGIRMEG
jgi:dTDP-4-amino-4,6-dideoxygalactose transaminase